MAKDLNEVASAVVRRAQRQGFVVPRDIKAELSLAGFAEDQWQGGGSPARGSLNYRQGRYYHLSAFRSRLQQDQSQKQQIARTVRKLIRQYRAASSSAERRQEERIDYVQVVKVQTEDGKVFTLMSRDLSPTGIRLVGTCRLLGQKVRIFLPDSEGAPQVFLVRILWTCALGDDLFENGGTFLEAVGS